MPDRMRPTGSDSVARSDGGPGRFLSRQEATSTYVQQSRAVNAATARRRVTDLVTTSGSATVTSGQAAFTSSDVGKAISGYGIPAGAVVAAVTNATTATLSSPATSSTSATRTVTGTPSLASASVFATSGTFTSADIGKPISGLGLLAGTVVTALVSSTQVSIAPIGIETALARTVTDGATTSGSVTVTSTNAAFTQQDVGKAITGTGIPASTTIVAVNDTWTGTVATPPTATLSQSATATATGVSVTIGGPVTLTIGGPIPAVIGTDLAAPGYVPELTTVSDWTVNTPYAAGQPVIYYGRLYTAKSDHIAAWTFNSSLWNDLGAFTPPARNLTLYGNAAGGDAYDTSPRLTIVSYQRPNFGNYFGEGIRFDLAAPGAKNMLAWRAPTDPTQPASAANPMKTIAWAGAHYLPQDETDLLHAHWSIEVPDAAGVLRTRFGIDFADRTTGTIGLNVTQMGTSRANFVVQGNSGGNLIIEAGSGQNRQIIFNTYQTANGTGASAGARWKLGPNDTESAGTVGSNFQLDRYSDSGVLAGTDLFVRRSTGNITIGSSSVSGNAKLMLEWNGDVDANGPNGIQTKPTALRSGYAHWAALALATSDRILAVRVGADAVDRVALWTDSIEWGSGSASRDVSLARTAAGVLAMGASQVFKTGRAVTGSRPSASTVGQGAQFFDTTLNKPIWSDGTNWKDAAGTTV